MKATYRKLLTLAAALLTAAGFIACQDDQSQEWNDPRLFLPTDLVNFKQDNGLVVRWGHLLRRRGIPRRSLRRCRIRRNRRHAGHSRVRRKELRSRIHGSRRRDSLLHPPLCAGRQRSSQLEIPLFGRYDGTDALGLQRGGLCRHDLHFGRTFVDRRPRSPRNPPHSHRRGGHSPRAERRRDPGDAGRGHGSQSRRKIQGVVLCQRRTGQLCLVHDAPAARGRDPRHERR